MSSGLDARKQAIETGINLESDTVKQSALDVLAGQDASNHARDDALSPREFEQLIAATYEIANERIACETRAVLYLAGRVGLRKGEITHLDADWFDWSDGSITIPEFSIMGWSDPGTARAYVTSNDEQAAREIRSKHR